MTSYRLQRQGDVDLVFDGDVLATGNTRKGRGPSRWSEVTIYRTNPRRMYVVEVTGKSSVPGEHDRRTATVCAGPTSVRAALYTPYNDLQGGRRFMTNLARQVLTDAAALDPALAVALEERI